MEDRLREIIISITNQCNLRCAMCQIPEAGNSGEMTTQEIKELIIDATKFSPNSIVFSGGEPLLRKDIFRLISFANQRRINTCLTSNGTLIDNEVAKQLAYSGIGIVNISIEGPEGIHDSLRGRGTFKKALKALENLSHYKIETTIATIVCRQNCAFLASVFELAHRLGVTTVKFQPFSEIFLIKKDEKKKFFASVNALKEIRQNIEEAIILSKKYKIATNPVNYLYSIPAYLCGLWQIPSDNGCSALSSSCSISADGNVYLCWILSDRILGNIKKVKLSKIWNSEKHNWERQKIIKNGCPRCLMSCYDYNFGRYNLQETVSLKTKKFTKPKFYKRQYYRIYQYLRYVLGKIINRTVNLNIFYRRDSQEIINLVKEIKIAKNVLKSKLISMGKYE